MWKSKKLWCDILMIVGVIYQICFWALSWWIVNFTTLLLEKRKFCIWLAICLLQATELSQTHATPFLVRKSVLIEWCWDCYQLTGLTSSFFRSLVKISWSLRYFRIFIANKEKGISQLFLRILPKRINQSKGQMCLHKAMLL